MKHLLAPAFLLLLSVLPATAARSTQKALENDGKLLFNEEMIVRTRERISTHPWAARLWENLQQELSVPPVPHLGENPGFPEGIWNRYAALHYRISGDGTYLPSVVGAIRKAFRLDCPDDPLFPGKPKQIAWDWCMYNSNLLVAYDLLKEHPSLIKYKETMDARLDEVIAACRRFLDGRKTVNNTGFWVSAVIGMAGYLRDDLSAVSEAIDGDCGFKAKLMEFRDGGRFNPEPVNYTTNYIDCCLLILAECSRNNGGEDLYSYVAPNGASLRRLAESYFEITTACGTAVGNGDFGDYVLMDGARPVSGGVDIFYGDCGPSRGCHKMEIFNARYHDPKFAWAIAQNPARDNRCFVFWGWTALTHGEDISNAAPPQARSVVFPEMGNAILRSCEDGDYWNSDAITAHLRSGRPLKTHNQRDPFNLTLNAFGKNVYRDWFLRWDYLAPRASNGRRNSTPLSPRIIGHNTVSVDFSEPKQLSATDFSPIHSAPGIRTVTASGEVYKGVRESRTLALTDDYLIDIFTLTSDTEHNFDYTLHSAGTATFKGTSKWRDHSVLNEEYGMGPIDSAAVRPNNVWFSSARISKAGKEVTADFLDTDGIGVRAILIEAGDTEVISAGTPFFVSIRGWDDISPDATIPERKPMTIFRRKGKTAQFILVHQPYRGNAPELRITRKGDILEIIGSEYADTFNLSSFDYSRKTRQRSTILAIGDSLTERADSYLPALSELLRQDGRSFELVGPHSRDSRFGEYRQAGFSGKNADFLASRIEEIYSSSPADIVLLQCGHNNFADRKPVPGIIDAYRKMISTVLRINPDAEIFVAQIVESGKLPKYSYIPELNQALRSMVRSLSDPRVRFVKAAKGFKWEKHTVEDLVHPNQAGGELMARNWFRAIRKHIPASEESGAPLKRN